MHRGPHLAERATADYEAARDRVKFIHAKKREEVIFTRVHRFAKPGRRHGEQNIQAGDELSSQLWNTTNLIPWQQLALKRAPPWYIGLTKRANWIWQMRLRLPTVPRSSPLLTLQRDGNGDALKTIGCWPTNTGRLSSATGPKQFPMVDVTELDVTLRFSGHKMMSPTGIGSCMANKPCCGDIPRHISTAAK